MRTSAPALNLTVVVEDSSAEMAVSMRTSQGAQAELEEVEGALLDVGVGEAAAALAADQLGLDAEVAGDGGDVRAGRLQELAFFGGDADRLEAGAVAEDGDVAAAAVGGLPPFLEVLGVLGG